MEIRRVSDRENGEWRHPANVARRLIKLCEKSGLPPIRLRDRRQGTTPPAWPAPT